VLELFHMALTYPDTGSGSRKIAKVWGANANSIIDGLMVYEKSVPDIDEDTITIAVEAARHAVNRAGIDPEKIGAVYTGSESHPYAVKPSSTVVAEAIGATPDLTVADFEFACKAGTAAIQTCMGMVDAGMIELGMAIGSDVSQGAPGDALEYTAAAGGVALCHRKEGSCREYRIHIFIHYRYTRLLEKRRNALSRAWWKVYRRTRVF